MAFSYYGKSFIYKYRHIPKQSQQYIKNSFFTTHVQKKKSKNNKTSIYLCGKSIFAIDDKKPQ